MAEKTVNLTVPAEAEFARSVRMLAANLAVVCGLSIDDVEDVRMAAEEGFVYSSATQEETVEILFTVDENRIQMDFSLGGASPALDEYDEGSFEYAKLILSAVSDEFAIDDDRTRLTVVKRMGEASDFI